jgi:8-oxo-dGTP pyrophosphatase MutT (NUDIX family)
MDQRRLSLADVVDALIRRPPAPRPGLVPDSTRESAVVAVLYEDAGEPHVVLTRRSPRMRQHAHEISFPGGRRDPDDESLWHTAVREATEEIALDPGVIEHVGALDSFVTGGSQSLVHPYVAIAHKRPRVHVASPDEVESVRHIALSELLLDEVWREEIWPFQDGLGDRPVTFFEVMGDTIWGATGSMIRQLLSIATRTGDDAAPRSEGSPA